MPLALACASHTPLMRDGVCPPDVRAKVTSSFLDLASRVRDFAPDMIIQFSPDHFNGFFYDLMPAFCVGAQAESIGDWGTKPGPLDVPEGLAIELAEYLMDSGFDIAVSYRMRIDHGFVQIWEQAFGSATLLPMVPIFVNCAAPPLPSFRRARELGDAVGRFAQSTGKRIVIAASGGLSHDPPTPQIKGAAAELRAKLIDNRNPSAEERAARERRVLEAGRSVVAGVSQILPVSTVWDIEFMQRLREGPLEQFDSWSARELVSVAGRGGPEVLCWVAACAAMRAAGAYETELHLYEAIQGWIAGMAILSGRTILENEGSARR